MAETCNKQCNTCEHHDKKNDCCKVKSKEEFNKVNFSKEKCDSYMINEKLIMF